MKQDGQLLIAGTRRADAVGDLDGFVLGRHGCRDGDCGLLPWDLPEKVYAEQLTSAVYLEQRPDVEHYLAVMDQLSGEALTPART